MSLPMHIQLQDAYNYMQILNLNMATLASMLQGRLTPQEEELLAEVFETQVDLQLLLDQLQKRINTPPPEAAQAQNNLANKEKGSPEFLHQIATRLING